MKYFFVCLNLLILSSCSSFKPNNEDVSDAIKTSEAETYSQTDVNTENLGKTVPAATSTPQSAVASNDQNIRPEGLIESLVEAFTWPTHANESSVRKYIEYYKKKPEQLETFLNRSKDFLPLIAAQIRTKNLPAELAFLPIVESGYIPTAYSPSGAAGLWQIMPNTADHLGLRINWWFDERMDINASTEKAFNYLEYLNKQFKGNWQLAIAAYNGGEGHVRSRMRRANSDNFWKLELKSETEAYLPRLLAISEILKNPDIYGISIPKIEIRSELQAFTLDKQVDLRALANSIEMDSNYFSNLNPAFQRWVSPPSGEYKLLIPKEKIAMLEAKLSTLGDTKLSNWNYYKVQSGDTLIDIARHHGITLRALMAVNELSTSRIYQRQELLIPIPETTGSSPKTANSAKELYIVQDGDSLWEIGNNNNVSVNDIRRLNSLTNRSLIKPGQVLILSETFTGYERLYQVKQGDSLSKIAALFDVNLTDLRNWNEIRTKDYIHPGQMLKIRTDS